MTDYAEILCEAVDTLVSKKIEKISFDKTIICEIINNSEADLFKYQVSNGSAFFTAYSQNTSYRVGDNVYVTIPNGDYDNEKIIIGKQLKDDNSTPFIFNKPFDTIIDITGNLIAQMGDFNNKKKDAVFNLLANDPDLREIKIWEWKQNEQFPPLTGFTRLGLQGQFQSLLRDLAAVTGDYGLKLLVTVQKDSLITSSIGEEQLEASSFELRLSAADMYGDPYNFDGFYQQEVVFDITDFDKIDSMTLYFYQKPTSFKNKENNQIPYLDDFGNLLMPNLFVKDPFITLGYDLSQFNKEQFILYSLNSLTYSSMKVDSERNEKKISLRWIHQYEDDKIRQVNNGLDLLGENDWIRWYKYNFGSPSADEYCGVYWENIANNVFEHTFLPDVNKEDEKIKVIAKIDGSIYRSNILTFTNEQEVENQTVVDMLSNLSINCEDNSYGNYFIYELGGSLIENAQGQIKRELSLTLEGSALAEGTQLIEWILPIQNTMIKVGDLDGANVWYELAGEKIEKENEAEYIHIEREYIDVSSKINQSYYIKNFYSTNQMNNTIKCIVTFNNRKYYATRALGFGFAGTSGTDVTLKLSMPNGIYALKNIKNNIDSMIVTAKLYDYQNREIDLSKYENLVYQWEWYSSNPPKTEIIQLSKSNGESEDIKKWEQLVSLTGSANLVDNYYILQLTLTGWGDYPLIAYLPIPIKDDTVNYLIGPTEVRYDSEGSPNYYRTKYQLINTKGEEISDLIWEIKFISDNPNEEKPFLPKISKDFLVPLNFYVKDCTKNICVNAKDKNTGNILWSQPLFIYQNIYPATMLNQWDGNLVIDEDNNTIIAATIAAGKKDANNTFSGVIMGDVETSATGTAESALTKQTGLYGYHRGQMSFGFKEDGTAFIGKSGHGRIEFDGNYGKIKSSSYTSEGDSSGMLIDLEKGFIDILGASKQDENQKSRSSIRISSTSPYLYIDSEDSHRLLNIGSNGYYLQSDNYYSENGTSFGTKIDLNNGRIEILGAFESDNDGKNYKQSKICLDCVSPYLSIQSKKNSLLYIGDNNYYLQSENYSDNDDAGTYLDLQNGNLYGYNFSLIGYHTEKNNIINSFYIDTANSETPLVIGSNFSVDWDGTIHADAGEFTGTIDATGGKLGTLTVSGSLSGGEIIGADIYAQNLYARGLNINSKDFSVKNEDPKETSLSGWLGWGIGQNGAGEKTAVLTLNSSKSLVLSATTVNSADGTGDTGGVIRLTPGENHKVVINGGDNTRLANGFSVYASDIIFGYKENKSTENKSTENDETDDSLACDFYVNAKSITFNCAAENQTGIYARFA